MTDTKLCVDCKHFGGLFDSCRRLQRIRKNLVDGSHERDGPVRSAARERKSRWPWRCGPEGRSWEPRE